MNGLILTRESLVRLAGFQPAKDLKRARKATLAALDARHPADPAVPDHPTRLKAAHQVYTILEVYPKPAVAPSLTGSLTVVWDMSAREVPPGSHRMALNGTSSNGSSDSASSSVIEDGERPPSA